MALNAFAGRKLINLAATAGIMSALAAGFYLKDPETLISDSFGRVMENKGAVVPARWQPPAANGLRQVVSHGAGKAQLDRQIYRSATIPRIGSQPRISPDHVMAQDLQLGSIGTRPISGSFNVGDRITIESGGYLAASYKIISIEPLHDDVTRVDTSLKSAQLMMVSARTAIGGGDGGEERIIRFVIAVTTGPVIVPHHDSDQTL